MRGATRRPVKSSVSFDGNHFRIGGNKVVANYVKLTRDDDFNDLRSNFLNKNINTRAKSCTCTCYFRWKIQTGEPRRVSLNAFAVQ